MVIVKTGYRFAHSVDCRGSVRDRAGGLCLIWREPDLIKILSFSENHIRGSFHMEEEDYPWFFSRLLWVPGGASQKRLVEAGSRGV